MVEENKEAATENFVPTESKVFVKLVCDMLLKWMLLVKALENTAVGLGVTSDKQQTRKPLEAKPQKC